MNEKLIEEAYRQGRSDEKYSLAYAPPVFEKTLGEATLTPTDDEREALARAWDAGHRKGIRWKRGDAPENPYRSEVPEPSTERIGCNICGEALPDGEPHLCSEPQGEPSNRVIVMCARCGLFPVVGGDEINSDIVVCDRCAFAEGRESAQGEPSGIPFYDQKMRELDAIRAQVEPSDAQVQAALHAYWGGVENARSHGSANGMRAALRAAAGVVGQEGEKR